MTHNDAFLLTQWLEKGVFEALTDKYLRKLIFAIMTTHQTTGEEIVLEEYEFNLDYCQSSSSTSVNGKSQHKEATINGVKITKQSLKDQANKFVRALIEFSATLEDVPEHRWITLQLAYIPETPTDYQPMYFTDATHMDLPQMGSHNSFNVTIGKLQTPHHGLGMQFKGVDNIEDLLDSDVPIGVKSAVSQAKVSTFCGNSISAATVQANFTAMVVSTPPTDVDGSTSDEEFDHNSDYASVKEFILIEGKSVIQSVSKGLLISHAEVKNIFNRMVQDGFLSLKGKSYQIASQGKPKKIAAPIAKKTPPAPRKLFPMDEESHDMEDEEDPRTSLQAPQPESKASNGKRNLSKLTPELSQGAEIPKERADSEVIQPTRRPTRQSRAQKNQPVVTVVPDTEALGEGPSQEATWHDSPEVELQAAPVPLPLPPAKRPKISIIKDPLRLRGAQNNSQNSWGEGESGTGDRADYSYSQ